MNEDMLVKRIDRAELGGTRGRGRSRTRWLDGEGKVLGESEQQQAERFICKMEKMEEHMEVDCPPLTPNMNLWIYELMNLWIYEFVTLWICEFKNLLIQ